MGLRKSYSARELTRILYTKRHDSIARPIQYEQVRGTKYYYIGDTDDWFKILFNI